MMKRTRPVRFPTDAFDNFIKKKQVLQDVVSKDLKMNKKVHMTDVLRFFSEKKVMIYPDEVRNYLNNKKRRDKKYFPITI